MLFSRSSDLADALEMEELDAWLVYDFRGQNPLAASLLGLPKDALATRRLAASFTAAGRTRVLVHAIEPDAIPASRNSDVETKSYLSRESFVEGLRWLVEDCDVIATEYCPNAENPYLSFVDAGTIELLRTNVDRVVSSGNLIQRFQAVWTDEQWQSHKDAEAITTAAFPLVWNFVAASVRDHGFVEEQAVSDVILDHFSKNNLLPGHPPIVARGVNSALPHYETGTGANSRIKADDVLLVDLWGRLDREDTIYSDLTRMAVVSDRVPSRMVEVFSVATSARDASIKLLKSRFANNEPIEGWEVDRAGRDVIEAAGFGRFFTHRTGHSITTELHGSGAHMDDLETRETRRILPQTGFSIEPGIYMPNTDDGGFGVRTEVNVFVDKHAAVHVTGGPIQTEVERLLA